MDVEREVGGGGCARRRRERRLRSMLRHERMAVAMALAEALHHSSGPKVMERAQHAAPRGQETGTRAGEGEVHEKNDAPRRQNAPHPGERLGCLVDPGPQRSDHTVRRSEGDSLPTPGLPVLAGASGEAVDSSALSFFVQLAVKDRRREEEELAVKKKKKEKAEKELQQARRLRKAMREAGFSHDPWLPSDDGTHWHNTETNETRPYPPSSSSGARRKRKKRRRKRSRR